MMQAQEFVVDSGSKQYCQTNGVFDLIGNLEEWVLDDWQGRPVLWRVELGIRSKNMLIVPETILINQTIEHH